MPPVRCTYYILMHMCLYKTVFLCTEAANTKCSAICNEEVAGEEKVSIDQLRQTSDRREKRSALISLGKQVTDVRQLVWLELSMSSEQCESVCHYAWTVLWEILSQGYTANVVNTEFMNTTGINSPSLK